jgi:hypothetical protein
VEALLQAFFEGRGRTFLVDHATSSGQRGVGGDPESGGTTIIKNGCFFGSFKLAVKYFFVFFSFFPTAIQGRLSQKAVSSRSTLRF